jgi:hypothetical protein
MGDTTRKIYFEVDDKNVASTFESLKTLANDSARAMIESANAYGKSGRDVNASLEKEIQLRERKAKLEYDERKIDITQDYETAYGRAKNDKGREKATAEYKGRMAEVSRDEREGRTQNNLLREIIETLRATARDEIRENRKGVEENVKLYHQGKLKGLSQEDETKIKIQSQILGIKEEREGKHKKESVFGEVFTATFLAEQLSRQLTNVLGSKNSQEAATRLIAPMGNAAGFLAGSLFASTKTGAVIGGAVGEMTQVLVERHHEAFNKEQQAKLYYEGVAGRQGLGSAIDYGKTSAEIYGEGAEFTRSRAISGKRDKQSMLDFIAVQKAYSLDKGQLLSLTKGERFGGGGAINDTNTVIAVLKNQGLWDKNSQTKIPEYLSMLVSLQEEQVKKEGKIDNDRNAVNISAMVKLGDKFARDPSYVSGMSNAIANPQNEYQQARSLSVLAGLNPGGDLWELQTAQQKGLSTKGYMSGIMRQIQSRYGNKGNLRKLALSQTLGSGYSNEDVNRIFEVYDKDSKLFDSGEIDKNTLDKLLKKGAATTRSLASQRTSSILKKDAKTEEAFAEGALTGGISLIKDTWTEIGTISKEIFNEFKELLGEIDGSKERVKKQNEYDKKTIESIKNGNAVDVDPATRKFYKNPHPQNDGDLSDFFKKLNAQQPNNVIHQ